MSDPQAVADASARAMYAQDRASQGLGMRIVEIRPGHARLTMTVREDMVNGHQLCHGGLIFTLADSAFAFACNTYDVVTVASAASIEFLLPAKLGDELTAIADERSRAKRTGVYDVTVRNQQGECVALFRGRSHQIGGNVIAKP
jgi:acyl-CoA thioesterase